MQLFPGIVITCSNTSPLARSLEGVSDLGTGALQAHRADRNVLVPSHFRRGFIPSPWLPLSLPLSTSAICPSAPLPLFDLLKHDPPPPR